MIENWFDQLKSMHEDYLRKDIFNFDESGLWPGKTYKIKGNEAPGIKIPKERVTFAFLCNMLGDKETLVFIWRNIKNQDVSKMQKLRTWLLNISLTREFG